MVRGSVDALREPYRSVIVMRHYEGLPPREIAARLGVPVKTVKTRLERGHAELRDRLGKYEGVGSFAALFAFLREPSPRPTLRVPVAATVGAAAMVLVSIVLFRGEGQPIPVSAPAASVRLESASAPPSFARSVAPDVSSPWSADLVGIAVAREAVAPIRGRVIGLDGRGLSGATVRYAIIDHPVRLGVSVDMRAWLAAALNDGEPVSVNTDDGGAFELMPPSPPPLRSTRISYGGSPLLRLSASGEGEARTAVLTADLPGMTAVLIASVGSDDASRYPTGVAGLTVVMAPLVRFSASAFVGARPAARATLRWTPPEDLRSRLGTPLVDAIPLTWRFTADDQGHFVDPSLPAVPGASVSVAAGGASKEFAAPLDHGAIEEYRLDEPALIRTVSGRLLAPDGSPVRAGAVTDGYRVATSDSGGWFQWPMPEAQGATTPTVAVAAGFLPLDIPEHWGRDGAGGELRFTGKIGALHGRIVDLSGRAATGVRVDLAELTTLWDGPIESPVCMEHVLAPPDGSGPRVGVAGAADVFAITDEDGAFRLTGLLDRPYDLIATRAKDGRVARLRVRPGPATIQWVWPGQARVPLGLRVEDRAGAPIEGAEVRVSRRVSVLPRPVGPPAIVSRVVFEGRSDADGQIAFACDDTEGLSIAIEAPGYLSVEHPWQADERTGVATTRPRAVVLDRIAFLRLDGSALLPPPTSFSLQDGAGDPIGCELDRGGWIQRLVEVGLFHGRSEVIVVPASATTIRIVHDRGVDLRPITLVPGELLEIDL